MHYANGRPAQNGDTVIMLSHGGKPVVGVLYDAQPGNDFCNGNIAPVQLGGYACLADCLRLDDFQAAFPQGLTREGLKTVPVKGEAPSAE